MSSNLITRSINFQGLRRNPKPFLRPFGTYGTGFVIGHAGSTGILNINDGGLVYLSSLDVQNGTGELVVETWNESDYRKLWNDGKLTFSGQNNGDINDHFRFLNEDGVVSILAPEPSTSALFGIAGLALLLRRHKTGRGAFTLPPAYCSLVLPAHWLRLAGLATMKNHAAVTALLALITCLPARASLGADLLTSAQTYGAARLDQSTSGGTLSIAGVKFATGLGVHAISEVPVSVPDGACELSGYCGMDDTGEKGAAGEAVFRILSGNRVLWSSPAMKTGDPAKPFRVTLPPNCRKVYLQVDDLGDNSHDHADWVNLRWKMGTASRDTTTGTVLDGRKFGLIPGTDTDQSAAMARAIDALRAKPGATLRLEKGTYHFRQKGALNKHFHISNHDQPAWHPVAIPLADLHRATIDGNGSLFLFHGDILPVLIQDSEDVSLKGIALDYEIPRHSQGIVAQVEKNAYELKIDPHKYPHRVENGWFTFTGEGWASPDRNYGIVFDGKTREIVPGTSDYPYRGKLTTIADGHYRVEKNIGQHGIKSGDVIVMRHGSRRPHPAVTLCRTKNTLLENFTVHSSDGMGILAQRSENIHIKGGGVFPRKGTGRYFSSGADATHFSNCRGTITTEGCLYEGMMDDAINVHATCLRIEEKLDRHTMRCRYVHNQAFGFETILPGEHIRFIQAKWLTPRDPRKVKNVQWLNSKNLLVTLAQPIPENLGKGDAIENADWHPRVHFKNNTVKHNRARGSLFTTPLPVIVEHNTFDTIAGSAILLAGDANGWYESGACHDVLIRQNTFRNNLTSRFQFTNAVISIYPEVPDLANQKEHYHRNIRIEDNRFETFDVPLLFAISTKDLTFRRNTIVYNNDYKPWHQPPFILHRCATVNASSNNLTNPPRQWTHNRIFKLHHTPTKEIHFQK